MIDEAEPHLQTADMLDEIIAFKEYTLFTRSSFVYLYKNYNLDHLESIEITCFTVVFKSYSEAILTSRLTPT